MACNPLLKKAIEDLNKEIDIMASDKFIESDKLYNKISDIVHKHDLQDTKLDYSIYIDELDSLTVNPKDVKDALFKLIPGLKQRDIVELQKLLPKKGSYIEPSEFNKYKNSRTYTDKQKAAIHARTGTGYLSGAEGASGKELDDVVEALNLHSLAEQGKITREKALELANKNTTENYSSFDDLLYANDQGMSMNTLNRLHREASIKIDKPMYIAKSPYMSGDNYLKGKPDYLVSASVVNPYKPRAYEDIATLTKLPKGTNVTFTSNPGEVVVELRYLQNSGIDINTFKNKINRLRSRIKELSIPSLGLLLYSMQPKDSNVHSE